MKARVITRLTNLFALSTAKQFGGQEILPKTVRVLHEKSGAVYRSRPNRPWICACDKIAFTLDRAALPHYPESGHLRQKEGIEDKQKSMLAVTGR